MLLENKVAVLYGAGGGIGRGVAKTFAREGARLFLTGRHPGPVEALAAEICAAGGLAEAAMVDALDEQAVKAHLEAVISKAGRLDISFNLISRGDVQGIPLVDMAAADYTRAVIDGLTSQFLTGTAAARQMSKQNSGVILMLTSGSSFGANPMMGSTPPADAAMESLMRCLAAEVGPQGVRVVGIRTAGVRETLTPGAIGAVNESMQMDASQLEGLLETLSQMTILKRMPALQQVADTAAFLASEGAGSITATIVNASCGLISV